MTAVSHRTKKKNHRTEYPEQEPLTSLPHPNHLAENGGGEIELCLETKCQLRGGRKQALDCTPGPLLPKTPAILAGGEAHSSLKLFGQ